MFGKSLPKVLLLSWDQKEGRIGENSTRKSRKEPEEVMKEGRDVQGKEWKVDRDQIMQGWAGPMEDDE